MTDRGTDTGTSTPCAFSRMEAREGPLPRSSSIGNIHLAVLAVVLLVALHLLSRVSFLLFHSVVEMFGVAVATALFLLAWNSRQFATDDAFVLLGSANLCIGTLMLLHTLAYRGMNIFMGFSGADLASQLWIAIRYLEGLSFLAFALLSGRRFGHYLPLWFFIGITGIFLLSIFAWDVFPDCFVEGRGLTRFKIVSEYAVNIILACAMLVLYRRRDRLDRRVFRLLMASFTFAILAGLTFTFYMSVYGFSNLVGHYFSLMSFFFVYRALIRSSLARPYATLFRNLDAAREDLAKRERYFRSILDHLHEGIRVFGPDGVVVEVNRSYLDANGRTRKEVVGRHCRSLRLCGDNCGGADRCGLTPVFRDGTPIQTTFVREGTDGRTHFEDVRLLPLRDDTGAVHQVIAAGSDVTELTEARNSLQRRLTELDAVMESTEDGILALDEAGRVLHANTRFLDMWEIGDGVAGAREALESSEFRESRLEDPEKFGARMESMSASATPEWTTLQFRDGRILEWYSRPLGTDGSAKGVVWSFRDVTERRRMEIRLADSERRFRTLVEEAPISIMTFDAEGRVDFVNRYHLRVLNANHWDSGYFVGRRITELPGLARSGRAAELESVLKGKPVILNEVYFPESLQGFTGYQRIKAIPFREAGRVIGGILLREDITEAKRMAAVVEEQAERYRAIINTTKDSFWVQDESGKLLEVNDTTCSTLEYSRNELLAMRIHDIEASETPEEVERHIATVVSRGADRFETRLRTRGGSFVHGDITVTRVPSTKRMVCFFHDNTRLLRTMRDLSDSLEEKVALLKEVHHRVKNNLQIVASLMNLQVNRSRNPELADVLHDLRNRIQSMALLHETLYRSHNLARIGLAGYVKDLCARIQMTYGPEVSRIAVVQDVAPVSLALEQAVPCGLIINELFSNALKHAFPDGRAGTIRVSIRHDGPGRVHLRVCDDGVGMPEERRLGITATLGLKLVRGLADQLDGELEVASGNGGGSVFSVRFPVKGEDTPSE